MKKIEQIYKEILYEYLEEKINRFTQLELSKNLGFSLGIVNLAIKKLEKINAVRINKMSFLVIDPKKILYLWASHRNIEKDIILKARIDMSVREIERNLNNAVFGAYSAYKFRFNDVPADYSEVYVYASDSELEEIKKRFKLSEKSFSAKNSNFIILKKSEKDDLYGKVSTIAQIFVDLWNLKEWYASDFLKALEEKINEIMGGKAQNA